MGDSDAQGDRRNLKVNHLQDLGSQDWGRAEAPAVGAPSPNHWTNKEPQTQGIFTGVRSHGFPHLSNKTQLYPIAYKLQCWKPQAKQPVKQEHNSTHKKEKKMRWQKNMSQIKKQGKNLQDQISEEEIGNLPEKEFRVMIVEMIQNPRNIMEAWIEKIQEMFNKDLQELKNKQTEVNSTITEMKNTLEGINNRKTEAEEPVRELEDKMVEITAEEQNKEKRMKRIEDNLRDH